MVKSEHVANISNLPYMLHLACESYWKLLNSKSLILP